MINTDKANTSDRTLKFPEEDTIELKPGWEEAIHSHLHLKTELPAQKEQQRQETPVSQEWERPQGRTSEGSGRGE